MRIAEVIGTVTLSRVPSVADRGSLADRRAVQPARRCETTSPTAKTWSFYDDLGAGLGSGSRSAKASKRRCRSIRTRNRSTRTCAAILDQVVDRSCRISRNGYESEHHESTNSNSKNKSARSAGASTPRASRPPTTATSPSASTIRKSSARRRWCRRAS